MPRIPARLAERLARLGPIDPRALYLLGVLAAVRAVALVVLAEALARGVVAVIDGGDGWRGAVIAGLCAAVARAGAAWLGEVVAARAAIAAKSRVRRALVLRYLAGGVDSRVGSAAQLASSGLDDLDAFARRVLPAVTGAAVVPVVVGLRILAADWVSALIVVLTVPLVPVFMALVGLHTRDRSAESVAALARLSDHLVELARGLPVLVGLGRVDEQAAALDRISEEHRRTTLATLRLAFLSSLVLELISTISVAVVAVFVGVRLVHGELPLEIGLLVLVLAPECFTPFRDLGTAFHAAQSGAVALDRARELTSRGADARTERIARGAADGAVVRARDLTVAYPERGVVLAGFDLEVRSGETVVVEGPSGAGKSTLLGAITGTLDRAARVGGALEVPTAIAWVPQHPHTVDDTVLRELRRYAPGVDDPELRAVLGRLGLHEPAADPARLSPGELRRLAVARGVARVADGAQLLVLDEPTAHLDAHSARLVVDELARVRGRVAVLIATHEHEVAAVADRRVTLGRGVLREARVEQAPEAPTIPAPDAPASGAEASPVRVLIAFLRPALGRYAAAIVLGTLAALFAAALTAVSGWLIVRASQQPPIMYLMVAIVGVRFFGVGRAALRYAERLVTHDAIFRSLGSWRARLWTALARRGGSSRALLRGGTALDHLVVTADRVRDLVPRVLLPVAVGVAVVAAALVTVALLHAPALPVFAAALAVALVLAPLVTLVADSAASAGAGRFSSALTRRMAAALPAAAELRANGAADRASAELLELDARAGDTVRRSALAAGLGSAVVVLACTAASVLVLPATVAGIAAGTLPTEIVAVLALLPLGLIDPLLAVVDAVQHAPALAAALRRTGELADPVDPAPRATDTGPSRVEELRIDGVTARWPGAAVPVVEGVDAVVQRGEWLAIEGPSGAGKSTLLSVLVGQLPAERGHVLLDGVDVAGLDATSLARRMVWCPQEGHLFDSTVRANLLLARPRDDAPRDGELWAALDAVGLADALRAHPAGLDARLGSEGAGLSGGQRQRLAIARTLLSRADVVLLDEPTAHLDAATAGELMRRLRVALADRIVVLVTHHPDDMAPGDLRLALGRAAVAAG
ncbi:ATP-binding cassette subfamily C protein CydCD [Diaminobutyricimonas aerilata]|uniref:ATP-binding cassette subfamily C protein CydCD n=1 Tax=Diaminobutyricimonas aerilata TaxID=1162967 RepID=A0A2M9CLW5_9MICO|nr:thiol reductant ABC exporter subunit CydC [Diaminobutyricimonas aerilata]PJJ72887.1 ATP-binding cassette subfamily C protein CydCD [Diaminobutyricimonas aerilata]